MYDYCNLSSNELSWKKGLLINILYFLWYQNKKKKCGKFCVKKVNKWKNDGEFEKEKFYKNIIIEYNKRKCRS